MIEKLPKLAPSSIEGISLNLLCILQEIKEHLYSHSYSTIVLHTAEDPINTSEHQRRIIVHLNYSYKTILKARSSAHNGSHSQLLQFYIQLM